MPLTAFQKEVLEVLVTNRSEASHFAGGLVLNAPEDSARYSDDFDVFHEAVEDLVAASEPQKPSRSWIERWWNAA